MKGGLVGPESRGGGSYGSRTGEGLSGRLFEVVGEGTYSRIAAGRALLRDYGTPATGIRRSGSECLFGSCLLQESRSDSLPEDLHERIRSTQIVPRNRGTG